MNTRDKKKKSVPQDAETAPVAETEIENPTPAAEDKPQEIAEEISTLADAEGNVAEAAAPVVQKPRGDKVLTKAQRRKRTAIRWILMNVGIILMSLSVYFFQMPYNFVLGGVGGISIMLSTVITPLVPWLTKAVIMLFINVFLLVLGFIILGKSCTFKTAYCSVLYTGIILFLEKVIPLDKPVTAVFDAAGNITGGHPFLELCFAILLFGVGGAIIFNCGASSGALFVPRTFCAHIPSRRNYRKLRKDEIHNNNHAEAGRNFGLHFKRYPTRSNDVRRRGRLHARKQKSAYNRL